MPDMSNGTWRLTRPLRRDQNGFYVQLDRGRARVHWRSGTTMRQLPPVGTRVRLYIDRVGVWSVWHGMFLVGKAVME